MGGKSQAKSRPKPPAQNLDEMDAGTEGLDQAFLQIKKNDQELDQELDLVHQGVKRLGVMASVSLLFPVISDSRAAAELVAHASVRIAGNERGAEEPKRHDPRGEANRQCRSVHHSERPSER